MDISIISILKTFGDVGQYALPVGVGLRAIYRGHGREGLTLGAAAYFQQIVLNALKKSFSSPRPYPYHHRFDSFPSGHTAGAFLAVGFTLAFELLNSKDSSIAYKTCLILLALLVGISRCLCHMHWMTDVIGGSCLGLIFGSASALLPYLVRKITVQKSSSYLID